ncbi:uncharacterized protein PGTG_08900 [Puccinia graminis f. sp. tritici CRL 75-36-700-3]|uniref:Uncharacterized protein n=1 Tax=Puccinia graminis f. sp. tritici (strain CRL 75-36-700-3 / race SCCL) TaxID=418459 RepID=E3KEH1_PUCGT|nr:uncharacterized protein PGTG_08900 [Puccinia graminis f. sp. tritici CRL 75-36-700-3]EFP82704.2 hypothetical protein PGTG_08900 [Puccinia graminis f. sp. tritici CRL 75-36-700-3]
MAAAAKAPPWFDLAGRTVDPLFRILFANTASSVRVRWVSRLVLFRELLKIKDKARLPFLSPSSSTPIPSSMARSIFDRPPTPYPTQAHPQPFATARVHHPMAMIVDHPANHPAPVTTTAGSLPLAARISPAGATPVINGPPFQLAGRGPPPAYSGPGLARPAPGYRRYNIGFNRGGFRGSFNLGSNFRPRGSISPFHHFNQRRQAPNRLRTPVVTVNRASIGAPDFPLTAPPSRIPSTPASSVEELNLVRSNSSSSISSVASAEDFVLPRPRVPSPTPAGMYDPADYHLLLRHQVEALLDRRADPARFDRYAFTPQHIDDLYESITTAMVNHFTTYPAANAAEHESRVRLFRFASGRHRTMTRRPPPRKPASMDD